MHGLTEMDLLDFEEKDFDTIIGKDIVFKGRIRFKKPLMIRGKVSGTVETESDLVLDKGSSVASDIVADRVLVRGTVQGNINSDRIIVVTSSGDVKGNIRSHQIVLEPGNSFTGYCEKVSK
jgi:cytoskeletal protein CcmA (bactofilin family)